MTVTHQFLQNLKYKLQDNCPKSTDEIYKVVYSQLQEHRYAGEGSKSKAVLAFFKRYPDILIFALNLLNVMDVDKPIVPKSQATTAAFSSLVANQERSPQSRGGRFDHKRLNQIYRNHMASQAYKTRPKDIYGGKFLAAGIKSKSIYNMKAQKKKGGDFLAATLNNLQTNLTREMRNNEFNTKVNDYLYQSGKPIRARAMNAINSLNNLQSRVSNEISKRAEMNNSKTKLLEYKQENLNNITEENLSETSPGNSCKEALNLRIERGALV